jgi:endonuclease/exonuclease/phosphatase family metal-dependent hydrolase
MSSADSGRPTARVLHWNVHSWRDTTGRSNLGAVADLVTDTAAHVVTLVEVDEPWGAAPTLSELAGRCGYSWAFAPTLEYGDQTPAGGFGNALLTRLPVLAIQQWHLLWPVTTYDGTEESEARSVLLAKLGSSRHPFWIGSTHLPRGDPHARTAALTRLMALVNGLDAPWIICGDFNTPAASWLDDRSTVTASPDPAQPTYPADQPAEPIDYCLAAPDIVTEAIALPRPGSDHLPVLASTRLTIDDHVPYRG